MDNRLNKPGTRPRHRIAVIATALKAALLLLPLLPASCRPVKPYQRNYLNDHEMQAGQKNAARPEQNAMSYREGATGGGGGKASGGCGCN